MRSTNHPRLYAAAARVLRRCANGQDPLGDDLQFLSRHALPCDAGMNPAELAGTTIWRLQQARHASDSAS